MDSPGKLMILNGKVIPVSRGRVSPLDRGFLYGDGVFETLRVLDGVPLALEMHLQRLRRSAKALQIPLEYSNREIRQMLEELTGSGNGVAPGRAAASGRRVSSEQGWVVRMTLTRGVGGKWCDLSSPCPSFLVTAAPFLPPPAWFYADGVRARTIVDDSSVTSPYKTTGYLRSILARSEVEKKGLQEAIFVSRNGRVKEGAATNLFCVRGKILTTPAVTEGILSGITRSIVLRLAGQDGLPVREGALPLRSLYLSGEAFLTSSLLGIVPLSEVNGRKIGKGIPGPVTRRLMGSHEEWIEREVKRSTRGR